MKKILLLSTLLAPALLAMEDLDMTSKEAAATTEEPIIDSTKGRQVLNLVLV